MNYNDRVLIKSNNIQNLNIILCIYLMPNMEHLPDELIEYIFSFTDTGSTFKKILLTCKRWYTLQTKVFPKGKSMFSNHLITLLKFFPHKPWNWQGISCNPNITWDLIYANPDKPWNWYKISSNPKITWDIINTNPDKPWDWVKISFNPNITWDIICANPDKPWEWFGISCNPNITWDIICANPDKPWEWFGIS